MLTQGPMIIMMMIGVRWRFPASDRVLGMIALMNNQTWSNGMQLTLNSKQPLHQDQFREVFTHLSNKMEVLRMCFRKRGDTMWIAEMPTNRVDFQVVPWKDINDEFHNMLLEPYNLSEGPLWCVRLMPCPEYEPCNYPDIKKAYPHQYNVLMSFHHAMIDGVTAFMVVGMMFRLLEDLVEGNHIDNNQFGEVVGDAYIVELEDKIRAELENDPERLALLLKEHSMKEDPILIQALGLPDVRHPSTLVHPPFIIDDDVITSLQRKCHARGVTLNSGLMGILNTTLIELVREEGLERDHYTINTKHPVNLQRYMPGNKAQYLGYYAQAMAHSMTVPNNIRDQFWKYVKKFDVEFKNKLDRNYACEERVLDTMIRPPGYSHEQHFANTVPVMYDFSFTNVYSGKKLQIGIGKNIQMTLLMNRAEITNCEFGMLFGVGGFRDFVFSQLLYSTKCISPENAKRVADKTRSVMYEIARSNE